MHLLKTKTSCDHYFTHKIFERNENLKIKYTLRVTTVKFQCGGGNSGFIKMF